MRITFVLPTVDMSGGIKVTAIYAKAMAARGHKVTLVSPPPRVQTLRQKLKSLFAGNGWPKDISIPCTPLDGSGLDHRVLDRWRPITDDDVPDADVIVATWWETAEWVGRLSDHKGAKVHFIQHHEVFDHLPVERCMAAYRLPFHKIVISKWLADIMRDQYGDRNVTLIHNAVDHGQFHAPVRGKQPVPTVGFLYHIVAFKGVDVTLKAIDRLSRDFPGLKIISFGSEVPHEAIFTNCRIEFHHLPAQEKLRELYACCDVWLTASRSEGFNLPAMEAMACRTPVVSTRTGWPEEAIVDGKNGVLVDVDDVDGLVRGARRILTLPDDEWRRVSQAAYATVAGSSWEASAAKFEKALEYACTKRFMTK